MSLAPPTNLDDLGSQYHATRVLMDLLIEAIKLDLPCLVWEIYSDAVLIAQCEPSNRTTQREAFYTWVGHLHIPHAFEDTVHGVTRLYAWRSDFHDCTIFLTTETSPPRTGRRRARQPEHRKPAHKPL